MRQLLRRLSIGLCVITGIIWFLSTIFLWLSYKQVAKLSSAI